MSAPDLSVDVGTVRLPSPILPASGTFSDAYARVMDISRLGALVPKTVTPAPRPGHPTPRLAETAGGIINAIGIPSDGTAGLGALVSRYNAYGPPVVLSLSADTVEDFASLAQTAAEAGPAALELNLSCPNLEAGGRAFALDPGPTARTVSACRAATRLPLWVKLSPNAGAPGDVAAAASDAGADALIVANTLLALALKPDGTPALANRTGGLSGPPLKPVALRLVDEIARRVPLPVIGCGGVATVRDVLDFISVGASAVAVGTASFHRATAMTDLLDGLAGHLQNLGRPFRDLVRRQPA